MNQTNENQIVISGRLIRKIKTDKTLSLIILVNPGKTANFPRVIFFGDNAKKYDEKYSEGDYVRIVGNVQSSKRTADDGKVTFTQTIFGESVEDAKTYAESEFSGGKGYNIKDENEVSICGKVLSIFSPRDNFLSVVVGTNKNNHFSSVKMSYFGRNCGDILADVHSGDYISTVGKIETSKKEIDGKARYFENVVIRDIAKV